MFNPLVVLNERAGKELVILGAEESLRKNLS